MSLEIYEGCSNISWNVCAVHLPKLCDGHTMIGHASLDWVLLQFFIHRNTFCCQVKLITSFKESGHLQF